MNTMNKVKYILIFLTAWLIGNGCSSDLLELEPQGQTSPRAPDGQGGGIRSGICGQRLAENDTPALAGSIFNRLKPTTLGIYFKQAGLLALP